MQLEIQGYETYQNTFQLYDIMFNNNRYKQSVNLNEYES